MASPKDSTTQSSGEAQSASEKCVWPWKNTSKSTDSNASDSTTDNPPRVVRSPSSSPKPIPKTRQDHDPLESTDQAPEEERIQSKGTKTDKSQSASGVVKPTFSKEGIASFKILRECLRRKQRRLQQEYEECELRMGSITEESAKLVRRMQVISGEYRENEEVLKLSTKG